MHAYSLPVAACGPQAAIQALQGWAAEEKLLAVVFVDVRLSTYVSWVVNRVEVQQNGVIFRGADNNSLGIAFPQDESEGRLDYFDFDLAGAVNEDVSSEPVRPLTGDSALADLGVRGIPRVEISNASGYLLAYELLSALTPLPTVQ